MFLNSVRIDPSPTAVVVRVVEWMRAPVFDRLPKEIQDQYRDLKVFADRCYRIIFALTDRVEVNSGVSSASIPTLARQLVQVEQKLKDKYPNADVGVERDSLLRAISSMRHKLIRKRNELGTMNRAFRVRALNAVYNRVEKLDAEMVDSMERDLERQDGQQFEFESDKSIAEFLKQQRKISDFPLYSSVYKELKGSLPSENMPRLIGAAVAE